VGEEVLWFGRKAVFDGETLKIYVNSEDKYGFSLSHKPLYVRLKNLRQSFSTGVLEKPFRIASGVSLLTGDDKFIFYIREPLSYVYPYRLQDFSGMLKYGMSLFRNALFELMTEVVVLDNVSDQPYFIAPDGAKSSWLVDLFKKTLRLLSMTTGKDYSEFVDVVAKSEKVGNVEPYKIVLYRDGREVEVSRGYFGYDERTNGLEILYVFRLPLYSSDIYGYAMEPYVSPLVFLSAKSIVNTFDSYFTPRLLVLKRLLTGEGILGEAE